MTLLKREDLARLVVCVLGLLTIPFVLTLLDSTSHLRGGTGGGWDWTALDYAVMGGMLLCAGLGMIVAIRLLKSSAAGFVALGLIGVATLAIWSELAVGAVSQVLALFGSP